MSLNFRIFARSFADRSIGPIDPMFDNQFAFHTRKGEERAFSLGNADGGDSVRASDVRSIARGIVCCSAGELASLASAPRVLVAF